MSKLAQEKEEVKALIRGLLTSSKEILTANALFHDFKNMAGYEVPYRRFGFPNFEAFLRSIPDTVVLQPSGGPSCNVLLVSSEKSKHIDELVQKQKISTKRKGPRKPVRYSSVAPAKTIGPSPSKPFIPQHVQKKIAEYLAGFPMGVEPQKLENHLWNLKLEQYGGFDSIMNQLTHIVKVEKGKIYPVKHEAPKEKMQAPQTSASLVLNALPSGFEDENSTPECDDWEHSWSTDEEIMTETKVVSDTVTNPANERAYKQPNANNCAAPALKESTVHNISESALKQPIANCISEPVLKQSIANGIGETTLKQFTANKVSEQISKQPTAKTFGELPYRPYTANNCSSPKPARTQPTTNSFSESAFKQPTVYNFSQPVNRPYTTNNANFLEQSYRQSNTANTFSEPTFKQWTMDDFSEPGYRQPSLNSATELANKQPKVKHLSDPAAFSTFMSLSKTEIPKMRETTSTSHISEKMKKNLQILAEKYPNGIWCSELPKLYQKHFGVDLNVQNLGFVSVVQFVADVPEIFQSIQPTETDWMVFDARKSIPDHLKSCKEKTKHSPIPEHVKRNLKKLTLKFEAGIASEKFLQAYLTTFGKPLDVSEWGFDSVKAFLLNLQNSVLLVHFVGHQMVIYPKHGVEREVVMPPIMFSDMEDYLLEYYPADVVGPNFTIPQQKLPPDLKFCDHIEVIIAEVFTPNKFWLQLFGKNTSFALDDLMTDMQEFYNTEYNNELYKMKEPTYREQQYCVAPYNDEYHRALIKRVFVDEVQVQFIDYGTTGNVKKQNLRYLHNDFVSLPAQAIRGSLANLQPAAGPNAPWPIEACKRFLALVIQKALVAFVHTVDYEANFLEVALVDTTGEDDVHINDTLKKEGYADYCIKKKNSPAQKQMPKQNIQVVSTSKGNSENSNNITKKCDAGGNQNGDKGFCTTLSTSGQTKISSDEEEPIIISAERRRVLPPPGFSKQINQQLPSLDTLALVNMALYQQALQQQQQQQMLQSLMMRHPDLLLQGNSNLGSTFTTPYATTNAFPVIGFPVAPVVMPNITQVPAGNASVINTVMPNITQVPAATSTIMTNIIEVPANTNTVDSATMTTFEEDAISELTEKISISAKESKLLTKHGAEENTKLQNNIVQEEDFDEDFVFRSDSEEEETDNANEFQAGSQGERNAMDHVVSDNNSDNMNMRQPQSALQHRKAIIGPTSKTSQPDSAEQFQKPVEVKVVEIAQNKVHIINIRGEPHMCTDELVDVFTNFSGRHVILKILESKGLVIPFKEIKKAENPKIFHTLQACKVQGVQRPFGIIHQVLHMIPLHHVVQLLTLLKINDPKILLGVHATLENCRTNKHFWLEPATVS